MKRWSARFIAFAARWWVKSLRYRRVGPAVTGPALIAFWHGDQLPLLGQRPEGDLIAPISLSRDGDLQTDIMSRFGIRAIRGSSSRRGTAVLRGLLRALSGSACALMAVDGPRGPRGSVKPGIVYLARRTRVPIYPVSVAVKRGRRLSRAWDRFLLPLPGTRVVVYFGEPWHPEDDCTIDESCLSLAGRLRQARLAAVANLNGNSKARHIGSTNDRT